MTLSKFAWRHLWLIPFFVQGWRWYPGSNWGFLRMRGSKIRRSGFSSCGQGSFWNAVKTRCPVIRFIKNFKTFWVLENWKIGYHLFLNLWSELKKKELSTNKLLIKYYPEILSKFFYPKFTWLILRHFIWRNLSKIYPTYSGPVKSTLSKLVFFFFFFFFF